MGKKILAGDFQGGHTSGPPKVIRGTTSGINGGGTMKYRMTGGKHDKKEIIGSEHSPMPHGYTGRVLYTTKNKRIGRQEGTGPQS